LEKEVTLRHEGTDVAQVLAELSSRCGVPFRYEPGAIQSLPPQTRGIRLVLSGASAIDALEAIAGATGLGYVVKDDNVYIWNTAAQQGAAAPRDRALAWIPTDSGLQIVITESQCPPDIREFIEAQKKKNFDALRKMMAEQGFKPTTQPAATAPSANPGKPGKATEPAGKDL
jgi:hypothetical protein